MDGFKSLDKYLKVLLFWFKAKSELMNESARVEIVKAERFEPDTSVCDSSKLGVSILKLVLFRTCFGLPCLKIILSLSNGVKNSKHTLFKFITQ